MDGESTHLVDRFLEVRQIASDRAQIGREARQGGQRLPPFIRRDHGLAEAAAGRHVDLPEAGGLPDTLEGLRDQEDIESFCSRHLILFGHDVRKRTISWTLPQSPGALSSWGTGTGAGAG